jgi:hypothetical protein
MLFLVCVCRNHRPRSMPITDLVRDTCRLAAVEVAVGRRPGSTRVAREGPESRAPGGQVSTVNDAREPPRPRRHRPVFSGFAECDELRGPGPELSVFIETSPGRDEQLKPKFVVDFGKLQRVSPMSCSAMLILAVICHASRENVRRIRSRAATFAFIKSKVGPRDLREDERHDWPALIRHAFQVDAEPNLFSSPFPITKARLNLNPPGAD